MKPNIPWFAYFLAVINATIIGLSFMFTRIAVTQCDPWDTLAFRFLIGWSIFLLYAFFAGLPIHLRGKSLFRLIPIVLFYPLGFFTFQAFGLVRIPSSEAGILSASAPIMTALLAACFIGEKVNGKQLISICISVAGVLYISLKRGDTLDPTHVAGIILILLSCLSSAGYTICNRVLVRSFTAAEITFVLMSSGMIVFSAMSVLKHLQAGTLQTIFQPLTNPSFVASVLYLGFFASLLTTILASLILKRITSAQLVIFFNLSTIVSIVAGYFFLNEEIHLYHLIGTVLIVLGVVGTNWFVEREKTNAPS